MPVGLQHHLQGKSHMNQPDAIGGIEGINARGFGGARVQQRAGGWMLHTASSMIGDLSDRLFELERTKGEEITGDDAAVHGWWRLGGESLAHDLAQSKLSRFSVVPKQLDQFGTKGSHSNESVKTGGRERLSSALR